MNTIQQFLAANTGLNLQTADLFSAEALAQYNWPTGADQKQLLQQLRTRQRMLKVYPDENVAAALEGLGFHSAHHIASLDANVFAQKAVPALSGITGVSDPASLCAKIAGNSARIRRSSFELALATPRRTALVEIPGADGRNPDFQQGAPDYESLFGPIITCDCEECESIFGPAAYFTDLMRVVTTYVTPPLEELFTLQYRRPDLWTLRLDCVNATTEVKYIDIVNAILQDHIEAHYTGGAPAMQLLASAVYPFTAPYNEPLTAISGGMDALDAPLPALYRLLETPPPAAGSAALGLSPEAVAVVTGTQAVTLPELFGFHDTSITDSDLLEALGDERVLLKQTGLRPDQLEALVYQDLKRYQGGYCLNTSNGIEPATVNPTSISALTDDFSIEMWIYPNSFPADSNHRTNPIGKSYSGEFAITINPANYNGQTNGAGTLSAYFGFSSSTCNSANTYYSLQTTARLSLKKWNHIALTRRASDGQFIIYLNGQQAASLTPSSYTALADPTDCQIKLGTGYAGNFDGLISEVRIWNFILDTAEINANMYDRVSQAEYGRLIAYWPLDEAEGTVAHDIAAGGWNATANNAELGFVFNEALPLNSAGNTAALMSGFYLNGVLPAGQYLSLKHSDIENKTAAQAVVTDGSSYFPLTDAILRQVAAFIRLQQATGWAYSELDWALKSVAGEEQTTVNNALIEQLGFINALVKQFDITVIEACSFWYNMKTYGSGNAAEPQDLWDQVYNTPPLMQDNTGGTQPLFYRPVCTDNPNFSSPVITWNFGDDPTSQDLQLNNQLAAALKISASDLMYILQQVIPTASTTSLKLSVDQLSQFYRIARFAQMLQLPVTVFIPLVKTFGLWFKTDKMAWEFDQVGKICEKATWFKQSKITIDQFVYLASGVWPADKPALYDPAKINTAIAGMINASTPLLITPDTFVSDLVNASTSELIYNQLVAEQFIDEYGLVLNVNPITPSSIYNALTITGSPTNALPWLGNQPCVSFSAAYSGLLTFDFDPFADETIQQTNSFTISLWVAPAATESGGWPRIIGYYQASENSQKSPAIVQAQNEDTFTQISYGYGGNYYAASAPVFLNDAEWVFLSWVNNNGHWTLYRNGIPVPFESPQTSYPAGIYEQPENPVYVVGYGFTGNVRNVSIWNTARSANDVLKDMMSPDLSGQPGLIAWWPMNEGSGDSIANVAAGTTAPGGTLTGTTNGTSSGYAWTKTPATEVGQDEAAAISDKLLQALEQQNSLVIKNLAPLAGVNSDTMSGICTLTGNEVSNMNGLGITTDVPYAPNMLLIPVDGFNPNKTTYLQALLYNSQLTRWMKLNASDVQALITCPDAFGTVSLTYGTSLLTAVQVQTVQQYKQLTRLCKDSNGLLVYFQGASASSNVPDNDQRNGLAAQTGWDANEINAICTYFNTNGLSVNFNTVAGVLKLAEVMQFESKLGMHIDSLSLIGSLAGLNLFTQSTAAASWQTYLDAATAVKSALNAKAGNTGSEKLLDTIRTKSRDTLCDWLTWELGADINGVSNNDELYEYLLIDVNMSPDVKTSWLVSGMNSLQLYVNRCISNLEPGVVNNIPERWWEWMSTYRVWQANREVYLYPENYVDVTLRKFQSEQFKQFISDVSKGQVTDDNVKKAMASYLESVNTVSNLELIDGYLDVIPDHTPGLSTANTKKALYLIARSRTEPPVFYSRTAIIITSDNSTDPASATDVQFSPWQEISLQLATEYVSTAVAFGRQFIFWMTQSEKVTTNSDNSQTTSVYATLYYASRNLADTWTQPVILKKDLLIGVYGTYSNLINYYPDYLSGSGMTGSWEDGIPYYNTALWQKLSLQVMPAGENTPGGIMVMTGPLVYCKQNTTAAPQPANTAGMTSDMLALQKSLYYAAEYAFKIQHIYTSVFPVILLSPALTTNEYRLSLTTTGANFIQGKLMPNSMDTGLYFDVSSTLIDVPVHNAYSIWPAIHNRNYNLGPEDGPLFDIISGNNGWYTGRSRYESGKFPLLPQANIPVMNDFKFVLPWGSNAMQPNYTFSMWLYLNPGQTSATILTSFYSYSSGRNCPVQLTLSGGNKLNIVYVGTNGLIYSRSSGTFTLGKWVFVTFVTTPTAVTIYLDGVAGTSPASSSGQVNSGDNTMHIGYFNGMTFDFKFRNVALNASEVLADYKSNLQALYLNGMNRDDTSLFRISNSAGLFAFNTGSQSYLVYPDSENKTISDCLVATVSEDAKSLELSFSASPVASTAAPAMYFERVNSAAGPQLLGALSQGGFATLFDPAMQYLDEQSLAAYNPGTLTHLPDTNYMNFNGAMGMYFWELFFYAPYLLAEKLRSSKRYNDADKWFRYIFNPSSQTGPSGCWPLDRMKDNKFPDLTIGLPAAASGITSQENQDVPFDYNPRTVWTFTPNSSPQVVTDWSAILNTPEFTLMAWIKIAALPASGKYYTVFNSQDSMSGYHLFIEYVSPTTAQFGLNVVLASDNDAYTYAYSNAFTLPAGWIHVAASYDGSQLVIYINGINVNTAKAPATGPIVLNATSGLSIGCGRATTKNDWFFNGQIADAMYYNYAIAPNAINRLYTDYKNFSINASYWNFRPFRRINATSLYHILNGDAWDDSFFQPADYYTASMQMAVYEYDPFDPDTIARLRVNAWQKATFMRFVENQINWGDALFMQDTWETLSDATMRYEIASTLLGRFPVKEVSEPEQPVVTYSMIEAEYAGNDPKTPVPPFLIEMENQLAGYDHSTIPLPEQVQSIADAYFCVPSNKQLLNYWKLVADRLFKIRHGLTLSGTPNVIPLFAAPIDPNALVAAGAGSGNGTVTGTAPAVPWFRFSYMINQARSVTSELVRLGSELLTALEKKDAEHLAQLQAGYQLAIYNITNQIKAAQVNQLQYIGQGLQYSYDNAAYVNKTYSEWMRVPVGPLEALSMLLSAISIDGTLIANDVRSLSVPAFLVPDIYGMAVGGMEFGESANAVAQIIEGDAHALGAVAQLMQQTSQYVRRELEWDLQKNIAGNQMKEIQAQITANNFALEAARGEATLNQTQLEQEQAMYQFLKTKFTNEELYEWMSGQLSSLYFQMYQLAWGLAQSAQTALQYELNLNQSYLNNAAWNASYQGLLAGDSLSLALQQMENAYISGNSRKLEIRKTWSMRQNNPQALLTLVTTGNCRFDINELSYDLDFPGHYNRKIKSLSVTIPAVVGPYQNIHASLTQTGNTVVVKPSLAAVQYLVGVEGVSAPSDGSLRVNWNPNQEIIISTGVNDAGLFQVNFNDEQYLPFEGTGAVSSWNLNIPQAANAFDLRSISDVIITVEYTAEDGGATFRSQVTALSPVQNYNGWQYLSMRQVFGAAWFNFCTNPSGDQYNLTFELVKQMYPANLSDVLLGNDTGETGIFFAVAEGTDLTGMVMQLNNGETGTCPLPDHLLQINNTGAQTAVPGKGNPWTLNATAVPTSILTDGKIDQTKLLDIILVMPFSGTLTW